MMNSSINERNIQPPSYRNDIFRKFELQFTTCFLNNLNIQSELYVEQPTDDYSKALNVFVQTHNSDIKFFIGYTGVGKTTFLKHYFGYRTMGFVKYGKHAVVIPASWDGRKVSDENYEQELKNQISNMLDGLAAYLYKEYETIILEESDELIDYVRTTRPDIMTSLTIHEVMDAQRSGISINQAKLQKSKAKSPIEFSSSMIKYVIEKRCKDINQLIFIVDDLETLAQNKLCSLITSYLCIYDCLHNTHGTPVVNLLFSLRPHSFRFLKDNIEHKYINSYGNFLQNRLSWIIKDQIPDVRDILVARFDDVFKKTEKPGNPETWNTAKRVFYEIVASLDNGIMKTVAELCHLNIRAIVDCLHMILSNRVWCQNYTEYSDHPNVRSNDYRFDIVNVVRTLACGENPVYTGKHGELFNEYNVTDVLSCPRFDDSDVFIPNILANLETKECDVFSTIIMEYLAGFFSPQNDAPFQTTFINRKTLHGNIKYIFGDYVSDAKIRKTIDFLFRNRIIRKSIISKDTDITINTLLDEDYIYFTLKGGRLLTMLESDSVLLEIYREDIKRNYDKRENLVYKSSFELVAENNRKALFSDLITLIEDIHCCEDQYRLHMRKNQEHVFYGFDFPISKRVLRGVEKSLRRSQNIEADGNTQLLKQLDQLRTKIEQCTVVQV